MNQLIQQRTVLGLVVLISILTVSCGKIVPFAHRGSFNIAPFGYCVDFHTEHPLDYETTVSIQRNVRQLNEAMRPVFQLLSIVRLLNPRQGPELSQSLNAEFIEGVSCSRVSVTGFCEVKLDSLIMLHVYSSSGFTHIQAQTQCSELTRRYSQNQVTFHTVEPSYLSRF